MYICTFRRENKSKKDGKAHAAGVTDVGREGRGLLKNKGILPHIKRDKHDIISYYWALIKNENVSPKKAGKESIKYFDL